MDTTLGPRMPEAGPTLASAHRSAHARAPCRSIRPYGPPAREDSVSMGSDLSESPSAEYRSRATPVDGSAATCPKCGTVRVVRPGFVQLKSEREWTPPKVITRALHLIQALTPQEWNTFELLGRGYSNRSIAQTFEISERTVKRHVTAILSKLQLESRLQAGLAALVVSSLVSIGDYRLENHEDRPFGAG